MAPGSVCLGDSCRVPGLPGTLAGKRANLVPLTPLLWLLAAPLGRWWVTEEPVEPQRTVAEGSPLVVH